MNPVRAGGGREECLSAAWWKNARAAADRDASVRRARWGQGTGVITCTTESM